MRVKFICFNSQLPTDNSLWTIYSKETPCAASVLNEWTIELVRWFMSLVPLREHGARASFR